ncbi:hypothetical protein Poli38472_013671 [Pythium oligandrum]|uniref:Uncharacterized protein n=1 Tax=Pythium oligandrum TaxID=41045 RepID=A0A8K1CER5_PYTOL|nr:hypothetical protein Poli38472_013671 [Pythium oligandrum]|eukprot:TMW61208.1 hypothetical protein Poli38472_013671 [Pythium oligandrum]
MRGGKRLSQSVSPRTGHSSPIHTPGLHEDASASYSALQSRSVEGEAEPSEYEDAETRGIRMDSAEMSQSTDQEVEMRDASTPSEMSRERRLTIKQLERFRRVMAQRERKRRGGKSPTWTAKTHGGGEHDEGFDNLFGDDGDSPNAPRELRFMKYPWHMWVLGALLVISASVFVQQQYSKDLSRERDGLENKNQWKYAVVAIVYAAAILVAMNGRVETFIMDKDVGILSIHSTKPLCLTSKCRRTRQFEKELRHIVDVRVEASGEILSGEVDTRSFKVHFDFDDGTHTTALDGRCKKKALVRCRLIKQFLLAGVSGGPTTPTAAAVIDGSVPVAAALMGISATNVTGGTRLTADALAQLETPPAPPSSPAEAPQQPAKPSANTSRRVVMVAAVPMSSLAQRTNSYAQQGVTQRQPMHQDEMA